MWLLWACSVAGVNYGTKVLISLKQPHVAGSCHTGQCGSNSDRKGKALIFSSSMAPVPGPASLGADPLPRLGLI